MPAPGGRGAAGAQGVGQGLGCQVLPAGWGGTPPLLPAPPRARPRRGETGTWVAPVPEAAHPRPRPASLPPPAPQSPQIPPPPRAPRTPSPAAPAFLPAPRREPRAHGAHLGYALSSHALQNSLRAAECRKTPRPPKVGRRPSSTTSSHSPRCQNCPRERGRCGWSREAPAPAFLPPINQSTRPLRRGVRPGLLMGPPGPGAGHLTHPRRQLSAHPTARGSGTWPQWTPVTQIPLLLWGPGCGG